MTAAGRIIPLRRPVVLHRERTPFVPEALGGATVLEQVEDRWRTLREANPAYFDGGMYHVIGVHRNGCGGASVHVCDCSYRFFAVQDDQFDLGVRPLGVKGMTWQGGCVLMGRRSATVAAYQDQWEFAPGGVMEQGAEPADLVLQELAEETGIAIGHASPPRQVAIIFDPVLRCWELICRIDLNAAASPTPNDEYGELEFFDPSALPTPLTPVARQMTTLL